MLKPPIPPTGEWFPDGLCGAPEFLRPDEALALVNKPVFAVRTSKQIQFSTSGTAC